MADVAALVAPAVVTPAQVQVTHADPGSAGTQEDVATRAFNAAQMSARLSREQGEAIKSLSAKLDALTATKVEPAKPTSMPAGLEERMHDLESKLKTSEDARIREKLDSAILSAAGKAGVDPTRVDYLAYKLKSAHGDNLSSEGIPDPIEPTKRTSVDALVLGLLNTPEGSVFRAAPSVASLPSSTSSHTSVPGGLPQFTKAQFEAGTIPKEIRKTGLYTIKEE